MRIDDGLKIQANIDPGKVALVTPAARVTYGELAERSRALAAWLARGGLQPGAIMVLLLPNGEEFVELFLAAARLGVMIMPLNPDLPEGEIRRILAWLQPRLVCSPGPPLAGWEQSWCDISRFTPARVAAGLSLEEPSGGGREPFYLCLTSGSSGRPKAVVRTQASWALSLHPVAARLNLSREDAVVIPGSLAYSASLMACLMTLNLGGTVHLLDGFAVPAVVRALEQATAASMVPSMYRALVQRGMGRQMAARRAPLNLISAGEKLEPALAGQLAAISSSVRLSEYYGAAELSFVSLLRGGDWATKGETVGRPFPGVEVAIRDVMNRAVPRGTVGTLWVQSPWLAGGYYRDAAATARNFRGGWATAGDLAWLDGDGYLHLKGREGNWINCGGVKVDAAEVAQALLRCPPVAEAAVVGLFHPVRGQVVGALVVPREGRGLTASGVRAYCRRAMARAKRPQAVKVVAELPRTPSGKIDYGQARALLELAALPNPAARDIET